MFIDIIWDCYVDSHNRYDWKGNLTSLIPMTYNKEGFDKEFKNNWKFRWKWTIIKMLSYK